MNALTSFQLEAACAAMAASNDPKLPLMRAAADGHIALAWMMQPEATWPRKAVKRVKRPVVFLVGDDTAPDEPARGPGAWACAKPLKAWARAVIVHGAAGAPEHYREALYAAHHTGRCAMIETCSALAHAWAEFFACPRTLLFVPPPNVVHPCPAPAPVLH